VGESSQTRKLLGDKILKFGSDFLETSKFWFTFFNILRKILERTMTCQNFVKQSSKTTKLYVKNPKIMKVGHFGGEFHFVPHERASIFSRF